jgi:hypothetical protein
LNSTLITLISSRHSFRGVYSLNLYTLLDREVLGLPDSFRRLGKEDKSSPWTNSIRNFSGRTPQLMCQNISMDPNYSNWQRYIGYIVDRSPNCKAIQDAVLEGPGDWSSLYKFMWCITHDELCSPPCSWPMKAFDTDMLDAPIDAAGLHINILEFLAIILNLWLVLSAIRDLGGPFGGWILSLPTNNTSALSWLQHSARTRSPIVCRLSRFLI